MKCSWSIYFRAEIVFKAGLLSLQELHYTAGVRMFCVLRPLSIKAWSIKDMSTATTPKYLFEFFLAEDEVGRFFDIYKGKINK